MSEFQPPTFLRGIGRSPIRQITDRAKPGDISFGLGEPDLTTPEVIRREAVRVILEEKNGYTLQAGLPALRERVASDYPHLNLTNEQVIITAGSQEAMYLALMTLVEAGDEVLIPNPGFVAYPTITRMAGGTSTFYRLPAEKDFSFDLDDFKAQITPATKIVVCTSPSNPTGRTLSRDELRAMARAIDESGCGAIVISDEIYLDLYYGDERPGSISEFYPRTVVISGLSKSTCMTGWRLGWILGDDAIIRACHLLHGYVTTCASTISQKAALVAWSEEAVVARRQIRETFHARRDHLLAALREIGLRCITPDGAFYTMVDIAEFGSSMDVAEALLEAGVVTIPGNAFGSESEGFLRASFCADMPVLTEGVRRIDDGLKLIQSR
ncbi:MAG TPA: aminotransferase class I/II-fold pyridoxal phosphate-dependent enzyme [Pyrinomonadaceae bacterium]|nr:aminotransferase class I/II-fold pyridoxal phosphate-dependent enzyme [Pyrinomonadaceae bacterium]